MYSANSASILRFCLLTFSVNTFLYKATTILCSPLKFKSGPVYRGSEVLGAKRGGIDAAPVEKVLGQAK